MSVQLETAPISRGGGDRDASHPVMMRTSSALESILRSAAEHAASDILLVANEPPTIFVQGNWITLSPNPLEPDAIVALVDPMMSSDQRHVLQTVRDLDMGFSVAGLGRYRLNLHYQRGTMAAAIRSIPETIPSFESLGLPSQTLSFADYANGLVLVTGGTGQGKSTTLAALIDHMNRGPARHIITVEDPVEFAFRKGTCLIEQRQVGDDSPSFPSALRHVLRQRPDVILIGELRDLETMSSALTAAETGHLVLATLHTCSASQTLARMIDVFPAGQQGQVRTQLAASLRAILCQTLLKDEANDVLIPATELMIANSAIRRMIRDNEAHLIYSVIETGRKHGMHTLEQSLESLVSSGRISPEAAVLAAAEPIRMQNLLARDGRMEQVILETKVKSSNPREIPWSQ